MGESTTTKRPYRVLEEIELVDLVDRVMEQHEHGHGSEGVYEALESAGLTVYVSVADEIVAKNAEKAITGAAREIAVTDPRTAELAAVPERNWTQEQRTLRPRTEVS